MCKVVRMCKLAAATVLAPQALLHAGPPAAVMNCQSFATLQACHDALPATGGQMTLPQNTTFVLTATLKISKPNVVLQGGGGSTVIQHSSSFNGVLISLTGAGDGIRNLTVDGNGKVAIENKFAEVSLSGAGTVANHIQVINAHAIAVSLTGPNSRLTSSTIVGIGSESLQTYGVWAIGHESGITIDNNVITGSGIDAIGAGGPKLSILNNRIANNHCFRGIGGGQLAIYNGEGLTDGVTIKGNTIDAGCGPTSSGMELNGRNMTISGNVVRNQKYHGIVLESGSGYSLMGNTITNVGTASRGRAVMSTAKVSHVTLEKNDIADEPTR